MACGAGRRCSGVADAVPRCANTPSPQPPPTSQTRSRPHAPAPRSFRPPHTHLSSNEANALPGPCPCSAHPSPNHHTCTWAATKPMHSPGCVYRRNYPTLGHFAQTLPPPPPTHLSSDGADELSRLCPCPHSPQHKPPHTHLSSDGANALPGVRLRLVEARLDLAHKPVKRLLSELVVLCQVGNSGQQR